MSVNVNTSTLSSRSSGTFTRSDSESNSQNDQNTISSDYGHRISQVFMCEDLGPITPRPDSDVLLHDTLQNETLQSETVELERTVDSVCNDVSTTEVSYGTDTFEEEEKISQSHVLSSVVEYSDTFEDIDDGISKSCTDQTDVESQRFDVAKREFVASMMQRLTDKASCVDVIDVPPCRDPPITASRPQTVSQSQPLNKRGAKFCQRLIKKIQNGPPESHAPPPPATSHPLSHYGIKPHLMERVRLNCILSQMKQAAETDIHDPQECTDCIDHATTLRETTARTAFIRDKTAAFYNRVMEDKIANHLANMDSITLIAELARSLPRPTTDAHTIHKQLLAPLHSQTISYKDIKNMTPVAESKRTIASRTTPQI